ncbi:hypothetical protein ABZV93_27115 [Actinopolymorpha sp. NPDC004070]|uniref:hypothetical protein n=1 Tax=Actinopolymorpha sp. NPDC004070 TaxID=3154548 RepID=UPI0033A8F5E2
MSWLRKVFGGSDDLAAAPVTMNVERRTEQLVRLENALDRLVEVMKANEERMANPAWKERMAEYRRISGECYKLRSSGFTREQILDVAFEVRPVFGGELPPDVRAVEPPQEEALAAAAEIQAVLPDERPTS